MHVLRVYVCVNAERTREKAGRVVSYLMTITMVKLITYLSGVPENCVVDMGVYKQNAISNHCIEMESSSLQSSSAHSNIYSV